MNHDEQARWDRIQATAQMAAVNTRQAIEAAIAVADDALEFDRRCRELKREDDDANV